MKETITALTADINSLEELCKIRDRVSKMYPCEMQARLLREVNKVLADNEYLRCKEALSISSQELNNLRQRIQSMDSSNTVSDDTEGLEEVVVHSSSRMPKAFKVIFMIILLVTILRVIL